MRVSASLSIDSCTQSPSPITHSYVPSAVKDLIKEDLKLTDAQTSYPLTGMILVYMVFSPFFG